MTSLAMPATKPSRSRALRVILHRLKLLWQKKRFIRFAEPLPRIGSCDCCGSWTWRTQEPIARSIGRAWLCDDCAAIEEVECDQAWAEYYSGRL